MANQHSEVDLSDSSLNEISQEDITATSGGVAADTTKTVTAFSSNGDQDEDSITLANASYTAIKYFLFKSRADASDTVSITPANLIGGTKITFNTAGEGCAMVFHSGYWVIVANNGGTIS